MPLQRYGDLFEDIKLMRPFEWAALSKKQRILLIIAVAFVYCVVARWALQLAFNHTNASPVWPPSGIAFIAVWLFSYRVWPAIWLGAFSANLIVFLGNHFAGLSNSSLLSSFVATGNTLEALAGVFLLRCFMGDEHPLLRVRNIFKFVCVAMAACSLSATIGVFAICSYRHISGPIFEMIWFTWWLGDVMGIIVLVPLLLTFYKYRWQGYSLQRIAEAVAIMATLILLDVGVFTGRFVDSQYYFPVAYLILPLIVWATYRFGYAGAMISILITLTISVMGTIHSLGPFVTDIVNKALISMQSFIGIITVTTLVLAASLYERQKAEESLRRSEERFRALVENSQDLVALMNQDAIVVYASPSITKVLGYPTEDYIGHHILELIHPEDHAGIITLLKAVLGTPGMTVQGQCRCYHKDGAWRWVEGTACNMLADPAVKAVVLNYRDITDKKKYEEAKSYLASIVESSDEAIIAKTLDGVITSWNKGAQKLYGYTAEEVVGKSIDVLVPEDKKKESELVLGSLREGKSAEVLETKRRRKDGKVIDVSLTVSLIKDADGHLIGASSIAHDITERKRIEAILKRDRESLEQLVDERSKELVKAQRQLKQVGRLADIGTLAATVAHELRNPLGVIQMAAYNLRQSKSDLNEDKHLKNIDKKVWEGNEIINNLLSYSRIRLPSYEKVFLLELLDECVANAQERFKDKGVVVKKNYNKERLDLFEADAHQMKEVFSNILNNAYQALPNTNGEIGITVSCEHGWVKVTVSDTGVGISEADLAMVFEPFFTKKPKGTGLGLSICNELVNLHQGKIEISSQLGKGTAVTVILPLQRHNYEKDTDY